MPQEGGFSIVAFLSRLWEQLSISGVVMNKTFFPIIHESLGNTGFSGGINSFFLLPVPIVESFTGRRAEAVIPCICCCTGAPGTGPPIRIGGLPDPECRLAALAMEFGGG